MTNSLWRWNSIDLWINADDEVREIKVAELFGLDETESTFNYFGAGSKHFQLKGLCIGTTNRDSLDSDAKAFTARTLTTPYESLTNLRIKSIKFTNHQYAGATIGGTNYVASSTPIYDFEAEFIYAP